MKRRNVLKLLGSTFLVSGISAFAIKGFTKLENLKFVLLKGCNRVGKLATEHKTISSKNDIDFTMSSDELKDIIKKEYIEGKTVYINNWVYSETEAKIASHRYKQFNCIKG